MGPSSAMRPLGHQPPCWRPCAIAKSSAARSTPVWPPLMIFIEKGRSMAERVRIEHTSTRKRADNGFEDREGHQAPITLRSVRHCNWRNWKMKLKIGQVMVQRKTAEAVEG